MFKTWVLYDRTCLSLQTDSEQMTLSLLHDSLTLGLWVQVVFRVWMSLCFLCRHRPRNGPIFFSPVIHKRMFAQQNFALFVWSPTWCTNSYLFIYNTFIKILYMFRALPCSSSGGLRRNCIYAASGIVTLCRWLSCAQVKKEQFFLTLLIFSRSTS